MSGERAHHLAQLLAGAGGSRKDAEAPVTLLEKGLSNLSVPAAESKGEEKRTPGPESENSFGPSLASM